MSCCLAFVAATGSALDVGFSVAVDSFDGASSSAGLRLRFFFLLDFDEELASSVTDGSGGFEVDDSG